MPNKKINELSPRTPSLTDLIIVGDPSTGYSYKATISVLTAFAGSNIQFSSLGGISLTSPANGQVLQFNGTSWVNYTPTTWNTAYDRSLVSAAVSGSTTKTLTLTKQDGSTLTATWSDLNTDAVTSVFGRTGAVVAAEGDYSLDLLSDVTLSTPTTNQVLQYNGTAWVNATFVAGINSLNGLTATTQTFATGTSGTDFAISSTTSTHTFNLPTASATNRGALSSADWTTFNSKVGGSGTTNYLSKWTSSSALGNSLVFDDATNIGFNTASPSTYLAGVSGTALFKSGSSVGHSVATSSTNYVLTYLTTSNQYIWYPLPSGTRAGTLFTNSGNWVLGTSSTDAGFKLDVSGTFRSTGDANINGLTVGKGGGSVATNTAVGINALNAATTGATNTAIGWYALRAVTTGGGNVAVGRQAMLDATGDNNVAVGINAMFNAGGGGNNVAVGRDALRTSSASNGVTALGAYAAYSTSGNFNTAVGQEALYSNTTGTNQVAVGFRSLTSATGNSNVALGYYSGYDITTGTFNTIIGTGSAGNGITTGSYNTIIGSQITGLSASLSNTIILADGQGNQRLYISSNGNALIGTTTDGGQRLQVTGDVLFKGSGNTSGTTALTVQNSDGTNMLRQRNDGLIQFGNASGSLMPVLGTMNRATSAFSLTGEGLLFNSFGNSAGSDFIFGGSNITSTSGAMNLLALVRSFVPTSGTASYNNLLIQPVINQTGGANGITRGLYVNPTLTAAADWRSIEWSNNSGWGLYGAGSANNYLAGSLGIGTTILNNSNIRIGKTITGQTSVNSIISESPITSTVTTAANVFVSTSTTQNATFTLSNLRHFWAAPDAKGASSTITNEFGFVAGSTLTNATNNFGFYGDIASGTGRWNLYMNGTANNYMNGNLLLGTTTDGGQKLQVTGTAFVTTSLNVGSNATANASAALQVTSTNKGFLPPVMTGAQAEAIGTPATGLLVYANNGNGTTITSTGWWGYDGTTWVKLN